MGSATADHIIGRLIEGQRTVVTDVGSYALAYRAFGAEALAKIAPLPVMAVAFRPQDRADQAAKIGDLQSSAHLGQLSAFAIGRYEQAQLQRMWNDPIVRASAQAASQIGLVDTDITTAIGPIQTPAVRSGPWDLSCRVEVARNAFQYMHDHFFAPSAESVGNQRKVDAYFRSVWADGHPHWATADQGTR